MCACGLGRGARPAREGAGVVDVLVGGCKLGVSEAQGLQAVAGACVDVRDMWMDVFGEMSTPCLRAWQWLVDCRSGGCAAVRLLLSGSAVCRREGVPGVPPTTCFWPWCRGHFPLRRPTV